MTNNLIAVLEALYQVEQVRMQRGEFDAWSTPAEIAENLAPNHPEKGNLRFVRLQLDELWIARKVLQMPDGAPEPFERTDVRLRGLDVHGTEDGRLRVEENDVRGPSENNAEFEQVAIYSPDCPMRYRSRTAEIGRLLNYNYQRFQMAPATGVLRYERRAQLRPKRDLNVLELSEAWQSAIRNGEIRIRSDDIESTFTLRANVSRNQLCQAIKAVMTALSERLDVLAQFQATSILATLAGLYSDKYRGGFDAHVITAGVGSGKSFAFQMGALIHAACARLAGKNGVRVLLLYPRVVLAANQFKDLQELVVRVGQLLNIDLQPPVLDAGSQLVGQFSNNEQERGGLYKAILKAYGGQYSILVSNLDTLAYRMQHPDAIRGLVENLDLIVCDEIHLLKGIYGSHAKMLLKRLRLQRELWQLRSKYATVPFKDLLLKRKQVTRPYLIGASATIAEPGHHTARLLETDEDRVLVVPVGGTVESGWVHHFFLRQKPEVSTMTALVNATSCLIHNRRDGLFREYYQRVGADGQLDPMSLTDLPNPIRGQGAADVCLRDPSHVHKTIGFCDSLDGVGRWSELVADNEKSNRSGEVSSNPDWESYPYFTRFQEPLWRHVHQQSFAANPDRWQRDLRASYGELCRNCKSGIRCSTLRVPSGYDGARADRVDELWSIDVVDGGPGSQNRKFQTRSYLRHLGIGVEHVHADWLKPFRVAREKKTISNLDGCPFFQTGLCWWWSMDHAGSNVETPPTNTNPLNGVKVLQPRNDGRFHFVNGVRLQSFTSRSARDLMSLHTINDIFAGDSAEVLRNPIYKLSLRENCVLVIGSPRLEVGVDLSRAMDGVTYRAMRDPSSLQQKIGRIGRELNADSVLLHVVTQNTRDQYYFRNPQIALDPNYLQALPLHEDNRIVARHHFFMAVIDFLIFQGAEPGERVIADDGDRMTLINDHQKERSFSGWDKKVKAAYSFLFGNHSFQPENLSNLEGFLAALGAKQTEMSNPTEAEDLRPSDSPMSKNVGAIDVFRHEFGPNFFQTPLPSNVGTVTLAQACASTVEPQSAVRTDGLETRFPRHAHFLRFLGTEAGDGGPHAVRSYLRNLLTQPLFRRGIPSKNIPGDHPYVYTPNFFESVGTETIRIVELGNSARDKGYESISAALALLAPGTVTYRYDSAAQGPSKVPVAQGHASGEPIYVADGIQAVRLCVEQGEYFEPAENCQSVGGDDLPAGFFGSGPVHIYTPRQLAICPARNEPLVTLEGMLADGDSRPTPVASDKVLQIATPPRCYSLRWFRIAAKDSQSFTTRLQREINKYAQGQVPAFPLPPVLEVFQSIKFDQKLEITDFVWGLDRQLMSRAVESPRLVYRGIAQDGAVVPVALGHLFVAPGLIFELSTAHGSPVGNFIDELVSHPESIAHQSCLLQSLSSFLSEFARLPLDKDAPWLGFGRSSIFVVRNLKTILLFHLLRRWHPEPTSEQSPNQSPYISIDDLAGCFTPGHKNYLDRGTFADICGLIAEIHDPASQAQHLQTLLKCWEQLAAAAGNASKLTEDFLRKTSLEVLLNSLGITIQAAGLRQTGAEKENVSYFYKLKEDRAEIFLFDTDSFGNGTVELIRDNLVISAAERMLRSKLRQLGHIVDPLPSKDFAHSLEEELQECASCQAAHLAYHDIATSFGAWSGFKVESDGERRRAGILYDFMKNDLGIKSFESTAMLRDCPEFLAYVSKEYAIYQDKSLIGRPEFPVFQALESACGYCLSGCVACVVSPESNLHGSLNAKETSNKSLLDAFYRSCIVETGTATALVCYPAKGPGCTCIWGEQKRVAASGLAKDAAGFVVNLLVPAKDGGDPLLLPMSPSVTMDGDVLVLRPDWDPQDEPEQRVRVHMSY